MKFIFCLILSIVVPLFFVMPVQAKSDDKKIQIMRVELDKLYSEGLLLGKNGESHFLSYYIQDKPIRVSILTKKKYESMRQDLKEMFELVPAPVAKNFYCQDKISIIGEDKKTTKSAKRSYCLSAWNRSNRLKFISWYKAAQDIALQ